jgi:hypothetical protein
LFLALQGKVVAIFSNQSQTQTSTEESERQETGFGKIQWRRSALGARKILGTGG